MEPPKQNSSSDSSPLGTLNQEITSFVHNIDALQTTLPILSITTAGLFIACAKNLQEFYEKYCEVVAGESTPKTYRLPPDHFNEHNRLATRVSKASAGARLLPQSFVVTLVSQYDSFLGGLLRCLYRAKPELLHQSEKQLTYSQLYQFGDLEQAKEHILEKEIEAVLRMSHSDQFENMEKRFAIELRKDLPIWPTFIELTERRNLFVHCNGKVSAQYLIVCDRHRVSYDKRPVIGEELGVTTEYFRQAHACIFEMGAKLGHVLWRKILPEERAKADQNLNSLVYDLLVLMRYDLAILLGDFALKYMKPYSSDNLKRMMIVNIAQAHKWQGNQADAVKFIDAQDWSSCSHEFKLAVAVLRDDFSQAATIMKTMGADGPVRKNDYRDWPLFTEFRKSQEFLDSYKSLYGQTLEPVETNVFDTLFTLSAVKVSMEAEEKAT